MKSLLVIAYACEPSEGSEPGVGWEFSQALAEVNQVTVLTRANNEEKIRQSARNPNLTFEFVDPPRWLSFWKKGTRGVRLFYLLWQMAAFFHARQICRQRRIDLVWHLTLANFSAGSVAALLGRPFVFGPVGGGVRSPRRLRSTLGPSGIIAETVRAVAAPLLERFNPLLKVTVRRASVILVQNRETMARIPSPQRGRARIFQNIVLTPRCGVPTTTASSINERGPVAITVGRLVPLKGVHLVLRSIALAPSWSLRVVGGGPQETRLRRMASLLQISDRVQFTGHIPRSRAIMEMSEADLFVSLSLHEEGGWAVAEAASAGLPVIYLDQGGPAVLRPKGLAIDPGQSASDVVRETAAFMNDFDSSMRTREQTGESPLYRSSLGARLESVIRAALR